jgi:hypothetical protein
MKTLTATVIAALLLPAWAAAQKPASADQKLDFDFPNLAALAKHKAEVDLDGSTLAQLSGGNKENAGVFSGLKGVHVRNYEFAEEGAYPKSALDPLRRQVAASPAWSRIVNVQEEKESTQIYILKGAGGEPGGLLVISAEAKEITVVEILGTVELGRLQEVVQSSISYDLKAAAGDVNKQPKP